MRDGDAQSLVVHHRAPIPQPVLPLPYPFPMLQSLALVVLVTLAGCAEAPRTTEAPRPAEAPRDAERPEWAAAFAAEGGTGTFVLFHPATGQTERLDPARAATRFLPASTFKLYNALVAVETGVVGDVDSVFAWDGQQRSIAQWNRDHTLRSGMRFSVVWLYQRVARRVGRERYAAAFAREPYGNGVVGDSLEMFWLDGSLQISADEEVRFVDRLRSGTTGFSDATEATVRSIVPVLIERRGAHGMVRVFGKTGASSRPQQPDLGWIVGWVERDSADGGPLVFAMNAERADGPDGDRFEVGPARLRIVEAVLAGEGILPAD